MCKVHFSLAWEALTLSQPQQTPAFTPTHSCLRPEAGKQRDTGQWWCQCGPRAPGPAPTLVTALAGLGSGYCGAFSSLGSQEGRKGKVSLSRSAGQLGQVPKAPSFPPCLPRPLPPPASCQVTVGRPDRGQGESGEGGPLPWGQRPGC